MKEKVLDCVMLNGFQIKALEKLATKLSGECEFSDYKIIPIEEIWGGTEMMFRVIVENKIFLLDDGGNVYTYDGHIFC